MDQIYIVPPFYLNVLMSIRNLWPVSLGLREIHLNNQRDRLYLRVPGLGLLSYIFSESPCPSLPSRSLPV
jgi:hypothetical protein